MLRQRAEEGKSDTDEEEDNDLESLSGSEQSEDGKKIPNSIIISKKIFHFIILTFRFFVL